MGSGLPVIKLSRRGVRALREGAVSPRGRRIPSELFLHIDN